MKRKPKGRRCPRLDRWAPAVIGLLLMGLLSAFPGSWEVQGAPPLEVTPRGTAPIFPGGGATPRPPTPLPVASTPIALDLVPSGSAATPAGSPASPALLVPAPATPAEAQATPLAHAGTMPAPPAGQAPGGAGAPAPTSRPVAAVPSAGEVVAPPGTEVRLPIPYGLLVVRLPSTAPPARLRYAVAVLSPDQQRAATRDGLLVTNVAFAIELEPPVSPDGLTLALQYLPEQVQGLSVDSLGLFQWSAANGRWDRIQRCVAEGRQRKLECSPDRPGILLLAGTEAVGGGQVVASPAPWAAAAGVLAAGLLALFRFRRKRA